MQGVNAHSPTAEPNPTAQLDQAANQIAERTGIDKSIVLKVLQEIIRGNYKINLRADEEPKNGTQAPYEASKNQQEKVEVTKVP